MSARHAITTKANSTHKIGILGHVLEADGRFLDPVVITSDANAIIRKSVYTIFHTRTAQRHALSLSGNFGDMLDMIRNSLNSGVSFRSNEVGREVDLRRNSALASHTMQQYTTHHDHCVLLPGTFADHLEDVVGNVPSDVPDGTGGRMGPHHGSRGMIQCLDRGIVRCVG